MSQLKVEDVWPLSPLQEGLLFHASYDQDAPRDVYVGQRIMNLDGILQPDALRASWQALIDRHASLRAGFHSRASGDSVQVIAKHVELPWIHRDLSGLSEEEQAAEAERLSAIDARRFDLAVPPLVRVLLLRLGPGRHQMVVTTHHILMDGWSLPIVFNELWAIYQNGGDPSVLQPVPPYRDYLAWLIRQDKDAARAAWRAMLSGTTEPTMVGPADRGGSPAMLQHVITHAGNELAGQLREVAKGAGVTLNRVFQVAWGLLAGKLAGQDDVVFGATVSGRPAEVPQVDRMVGLFINTVPVRVRLRPEVPFATLLGEVQRQQSGLLEHQHLGLTDIQRAAGSGATFDTLLVFQNYPRGPAVAPRLGRVAPGKEADAPTMAAPPPGGQLHAGPPNGGPANGGPLQAGLVHPGQHAGASRGAGEFHMPPQEASRGAAAPPPGAIRVSGAGGEEAAHYPLTFVVTPIDDLELRLDYRPDIFDEHAAQSLMDRLVRVLRQVAVNPQVPMSRIDLLTEEERRVVLHEWNDTEHLLPGQTIAGLFEERAAHAPDALAVVSGTTRLTYRELNERANRLAHRLIGRGVAPETLVGVVMERSAELLTALLAVVKAGAAYVPLDGRHPVPRLRAIMAESGASLLLIDEVMAGRGLAEAGLVLSEAIVRVDSAELAAGPGSANPEVPVSPDNLMYVMYTSGSSGVPKGVAVTQGSVAAFCADQAWRNDVTQAVLVQANHAFDASTYEIWVPLLMGGRLVLAPPGEVDAVERGQLITEHQVTNVHATAGLFRVLAEQSPHIFAGVREVSTGGDVVSANAIRALLAAVPGIVVRTTYGPTEATSFTTHLPFTASESVPDVVPIGVPMGNTKVFVLDDFLQPLPPEMTGELYIAGAGLARGYAAQPALSAERFVACPYSTPDGPCGPGSRMYRTGDLARWTRSGELMFKGRADQQVKIRGFRIEPAEVEAVLTTHEQVSQAAVIVRTDQSGTKRLVAYVVPAPEDQPQGGALREYLVGKLPEYMVPAAVIVLDALPLTANGKLDQDLLPAPVLAGAVASRAPATPLEELFCRLFADVLSLERVGVDDSFFELGGDSIMSMMVASHAKRAGAVITPRQVFELHTPGALARVATFTSKEEEGVVRDDVPTGTAPLTPVMLELAQRTGSAARAGSQSMLLTTPAGLTLDRLTGVLQAVLERHDVLRARLGDGTLEIPEAGAGDAVPARDLITRVDVTALDSAARQDVLRAHADAAHQRLNPECGVMVQAVWFDAGPGEDGTMLMVVHHLAIDGVSWRIIAPDLALADAAITAGLDTPMLDAVPTSFRRWATELMARARSQDVVGELPFWTDTLTGTEPSIGERPLDPQVDTMAAGLVRAPIPVPADIAAALLTTVPAAFHAGVDDVLLTGLAAAVTEWLRERGLRADQGLLVEREGHGRVPLADDMDLTRTVGWFTSAHPLRVTPGAIDFANVREGGPDAGRLVKRVKEQLRSVPGEGLGYGLLRYCNAATAPVLAALPAAQISFNYMGRFTAAGAAESGGREPDSELPDGGVPRGDSRELWRPAGETALGGGVHPEMPVRHALHASGIVRDLSGGLEMELTLEAPPGVLPQEALARLADGWLSMLSGLVAHTAQGSGGGHTPSDFPLIALGQDDIEEFESAFKVGAG